MIDWETETVICHLPSSPLEGVAIGGCSESREHNRQQAVSLKAAETKKNCQENKWIYIQATCKVPFKSFE